MVFLRIICAVLAVPESGVDSHGARQICVVLAVVHFLSHSATSDSGEGTVRQKTIKLNPDKLQFKLREIKFMGNIITDAGIRPDPDKVKAITELEVPPNKSALLRFIGMANYLSPYCSNLSSTIHPLRILTHDGPR